VLDVRDDALVALDVREDRGEKVADHGAGGRAGGRATVRARG
jgi:hypothetical protein